MLETSDWLKRAGDLAERLSSSAADLGLSGMRDSITAAKRGLLERLDTEDAQVGRCFQC